MAKKRQPPKKRRKMTAAEEEFLRQSVIEALYCRELGLDDPSDPDARFDEELDILPDCMIGAILTQTSIRIGVGYIDGMRAAVKRGATNPEQGLGNWVGAIALTQSTARWVFDLLLKEESLLTALAIAAHNPKRPSE